MAERIDPTSAQRRPPIAGSIHPATDGPPSDPVEQEWERIERERVAGEIAEAHEDVVEAIVHPHPGRGRRWVWLAFALALLTGMAFAVAVNLFLVPSSRDADAGPMPVGSGAPSANEEGPGVVGAGVDDPAVDRAPADDA